VTGLEVFLPVRLFAPPVPALCGVDGRHEAKDQVRRRDVPVQSSLETGEKALDRSPSAPLDETRAILHFVAEELGTGCYVNLMAQYYPSGRVGRDGEFAEIDRHVFSEEYVEALALAEELGLRLDPRSRSEGRSLALAG